MLDVTLSDIVVKDKEDQLHDINPFIAPYQCECGRLIAWRKDTPPYGLRCDNCNKMCDTIGERWLNYKGLINQRLNANRILNKRENNYYVMIKDAFTYDEGFKNILMGIEFFHDRLYDIFNCAIVENKFISTRIYHTVPYKKYDYVEGYNKIYDYLDYMIEEVRWQELAYQAKDFLSRKYREYIIDRLASMMNMQLALYIAKYNFA